MSIPTSQLLSLQFELAMGLSGSLRLQEVLHGSLTTLMRRLNCAAGAVMVLGGRSDPASRRSVVALPRRAERPLLEALDREAPLNAVLAAAGAEQDSPPGIVSLGDPGTQAPGGLLAAGWCHALALPGYGALLLVRHGEPLAPEVLAALAPLMPRLANAAIACTDHAALRESEQRYARLVANLPEMVFDAELDAHGAVHFTWASPRTRDVLDVTAEALQARAGLLFDRLASDDVAALQDSFRYASAPFELTLQLAAAGPSMPTRWVTIGAHPGGHAADRVWAGYIRDVTVRQLVDEAARDAERNRLAGFLMEAPDAVVGFDAVGRITHWNLGAERMIGHAAETVVGRSVRRLLPESELGRFAEGGLKAFVDETNRVMGRPIEVAVLRADGTELAVELMLSRVEGPGEALYVAILRDVTERRRAEAEHARAEAELARHAEAMFVLSSADPDALDPFLRRVTETVARALEADRVSLWRSEDDAIVSWDLYDRTSLEHASGHRLNGADFRSYFEALQEGEPIVAADACTHPSTACFADNYLKPLGIASMLDVPLRSLRDFRGVLCVETRTRRLWRQAEVRFCAEVAALVVHALDRGQQRGLEARHTAILAAIGDAVIACDLALRVTLFNATAARVTGWDADDARGRPLEEICALLAVDGTGALSMPVRAVVAEGKPQRSVALARLRRRDGALVTIASHAAPVFDEGSLRGAVLTFRDVTHEQSAQAEIRRQNERLRSLSEAMPDRLYAMGLDGQARPLNAAALAECAAAGCPTDGSGVAIAALFSPETARQLLARAEAAVAQSCVETLEFAKAPEAAVDAHRMTADEEDAGATFHEARLAVMGHDEVTLIVRDITERLRSSETLRKQGEQLNTLLATTSAVIYAQRMPDFRTEFVSESARDILGFTPEEMQVPGFWQEAIHPDDRDRVILGLASLFESDRHIHEYRHLHKDGQYRWLRDEMRLVRDPHGTPLRAVGSSFDISGRKQDEARLATLLLMQELVARVSGAFLTAPDARADGDIARALGDLGTHSRADRAYVFLAREGLISNTHEWFRDGLASERDNLQDMLEETFDFLLDPMRGGQPLYIPDVATLPASADTERAFLASQNIHTLLAVPILIDGRLRGFVALDNPTFELLSWSEYAGTMRLFADAIAAGLRRAEDEGAMRDLNSELLRRTERQRALLELSTELARAQSRDQIFSIIESRLMSVLGVDRISVAEFNPREPTYRIRLLSELVPLDVDERDTIGPFVNLSEPVREMPAASLPGTALEMAAALGRPVTTRDFAISDFSDWVHLKAARGYNQFAIIPLVGSAGTFGTLNVGTRAETRLSTEEVAWFAQFGTLVGANLSIQQARSDLRALNDALEERVLQRTAELEASEDRFERLFQQAPQPMLMVDPGGRVTQANVGAQAVFGYPGETLIGHPVTALVPAEALNGLAHGAPETGPQRRGPGRDRSGSSEHIFAGVRASGETFQAEVGVVDVDLNGEVHRLVGVSDVSDRVAAEAAVARSLHEKETLLKEIHHRVKNNLQIISSLLMLQSEQMPSPEARLMMQESVYRVRSMALIHQQLYGVESLERIDLGEYARALTSFLQAALAPGTRISVVTDDVLVTIETAVPIGLILNELLTNAFKYGKPSDPEVEPTVDVAVALLDARHERQVSAEDPEARIVIRIADNGPGLPEGFDPDLAQSLGLQLVSALIMQLRGRLGLRNEAGARLELSCPLRQD